MNSNSLLLPLSVSKVGEKVSEVGEYDSFKVNIKELGKAIFYFFPQVMFHLSVLVRDTAALWSPPFEDQ